jgi:hypothetical protein
MEALMAQTEIDPAQAAQLAGKKRVRIDWKRGADLLVAGETPGAVAAALGITEDRLWRHLRNSARFQFLLRQARETQLLLGRLQLEAAANAAAIRCARQAEKSPARLFEQFKLSSQPIWDRPSSADGRDMVLRLADSLRRAPKRRPRAAKAPDKAAISANKDGISENKTQISENKDGISADKSPTSTDKPVASTDNAAAKPLKDQPVMPQRPAAAPMPPSRRPPFGALLGPHGETIQRTDVFGRPLPDVETPTPDRHGRV